MKNTPLLQIDSLQTSFLGERTVRAVDGVSFAIERGQTFALLGESGCGKSMTALSIMRLVPEPVGRITGGAIKLQGEDLLQLPEAAMRRVRGSRIAMVFQEPMSSLNPVLTIGEQIGESVRLHLDLTGSVARRRVLELLRAVGIPNPVQRYYDYPHQFSGGMKQRVMIAMALAGEPELLIADEPTTALDVTIQAQVLELMRQLQHDTGMAILLITHDLGVVAEMADRVAVMYAGQIVEAADRAPFFADPRHPYARKLFESLPDMDKRSHRLASIPGHVPPLDQVFHGCRFADRCELAWHVCHDQIPLWNSIDPGGVRCHLFASTQQQAAVQDTAPVEKPAESLLCEEEHLANPLLLNVQGLKVHFPLRSPLQKGSLRRQMRNVKAVDDISFSISEGHTLALVGESGCGKTTVGKGILQLIRPTAGHIRFGDVDLTTLSASQLRPYRSDIQIIFQDPFSSMNPRMRVADIIEEGMLTQNIGGDAAARSARIDRLLEQVGLTSAVRQRYPHEFSGGQRQRICIARTLAVEPKLIICDEPTSALDVSVQAQILNLLKDLQDELGLAYLFITHDLSVVEYLAHDVAVMYLGRIVEQGQMREVMRKPRHPYTQALLLAVPSIETSAVTKTRSVLHVQGEMPSSIDPPLGCHFHPRCGLAMQQCREAYPAAQAHSATHYSRCFLYEEQSTVTVADGK
jgi:peptide/nickel transport system ATP-binding protein